MDNVSNTLDSRRWAKEYLEIKENTGLIEASAYFSQVVPPDRKKEVREFITERSQKGSG